MYCKVSPNSKTHIVRKESIAYDHNPGGYIYPICGLTYGPLIESTKEEFLKAGCKGCRKASVRRAIAKMKYGDRIKPMRHTIIGRIVDIK